MGNATKPGEIPAEDTVNAAVLRGVLSAPPEIRALASGTRLATLAVRTEGADGRATSVPVGAWDPPAWLEALDAGDEVVVVGRVQRRFFRAAGGTASRVEITAVLIARATPARVAAARRRLASLLGDFA